MNFQARTRIGEGIDVLFCGGSCSVAVSSGSNLRFLSLDQLPIWALEAEDYN